MNKRELTDAVAERAGVTKKAAAEAVDAILGAISDTVSTGEPVVIPGFGKFERKQRPARDGFNHLTKKPFSVPATFVPKFTPGDGFKTVVNARRAAA
jgi:DNA-binding protein HU-beta